MCKPSYHYGNSEMAHAISEIVHSDLHRTMQQLYDYYHQQSMEAMDEARNLQQMYSR